jgi:histidine ammonia-lyase
VTGLAALALRRAERLLDWADAVPAMSIENHGGQIAAIDAASLALRVSPGLARVGERSIRRRTRWAPRSRWRWTA